MKFDYKLSILKNRLGFKPFGSAIQTFRLGNSNPEIEKESSFQWKCYLKQITLKLRFIWFFFFSVKVTNWILKKIIITETYSEWQNSLKTHWKGFLQVEMSLEIWKPVDMVKNEKENLIQFKFDIFFFFSQKIAIFIKSLYFQNQSKFDIYLFIDSIRFNFWFWKNFLKMHFHWI